MNKRPYRRFHPFQSSLKLIQVKQPWFARTRGPWRISKAFSPCARAAWLIWADGGFRSHWGHPNWLDCLQWKILLKCMILGYPHFRQPPYLSICKSDALQKRLIDILTVETVCENDSWQYLYVAVGGTWYAANKSTAMRSSGRDDRSCFLMLALVKQQTWWNVGADPRKVRCTILLQVNFGQRACCANERTSMFQTIQRFCSLKLKRGLNLEA